MTKGAAAIQVELFRHLLVSICEEMGTVLRKTSYSVNIKERRDYSCAVYDAEGETVAMGDHMPVHLGAMPLSVAYVRRAITLGAGDVAIVNDPFQGGTHLPDITAVAAVYVAGGQKPAFFVANRAHHSDVGGMSPGSMPLAREIYQEGLRIPPMLLVKAGAIDEALLGMILLNVRTPEERRGDLMAQLMSIRSGEARLLALCAKHGLPVMRTNMIRLQDYSERMMAAVLEQMPHGRYSFEDYLDNDGISKKPVRIAVDITLNGGDATVDFSRSDPQAPGPVNANYAIVLSATAYVFRCLIKDDVPYTAGLLRRFKIIAPEGLVVNARPPAAMAAGNVETSQRITDVLLGALAQAAPDLIPAASSGTMNNVSFGGWDSGRQRPFAYYETIAGGMGAGPANAGLSATHCHMTNSWNSPVEAFEHQYPVRMRAYQIRRGSGGKGARGGGDGIRREYEFLEPCEATLLGDRRERGPYGLDGGGDGAAGASYVIHDGERRVLPGKVRLAIEAGDVLGIESPGGGGHGLE